MDKGNRIDFLDNAKGIGIFLVCVGHACTNQMLVSDCKYIEIIRFVTLFHMALFFFINGMLYNVKYSQKPIDGILKKIKAYYIPFVSYNLLFFVFHNLFARLQLISGEVDPKDYPYVGINSFVSGFIKTLVGYRQRFAGAMWFLEALLVISIVFILVDFFATRFFEKKRITVLSICIVIIVCINRLFNLSDIPHVPSSLSQIIYWGLNGLVFFYLGYIYKIKNINEKLIRHKGLVTIITFIVVILAIVLMRPRVVSVITNKSLPIYKYGLSAIWAFGPDHNLSLVQYFIYMLACLCGIIFTLMLTQFDIITQMRSLKILGKYSLHIMCLQFFVFKLVSVIIVWVYDMPSEKLADYPVVFGIDGMWWIAYTIVGCVVPIIMVKIYEMSKSRVIGLIKRSSK